MTLSDWGSSGGWFSVIRESFTGAWQRNVTIDRNDVMKYGAVWACMTLIAGDIAKLWIKLVEEDPTTGICTKVDNPAYSPVLEKPNHYQTRVKFIESWLLSKLSTGNTYVLKERNHRGGTNQGNVSALYVLDPSKVRVLVAPDGSVFYELSTDYLSGIGETTVTVPASEIIHDICVPLFHPLCGVSPIFACGLAAMQGLKIQRNSERFFAEGLQLSGILTAPGVISPDTAKRLEDHFNEFYLGEHNRGKVAALGDGLKFEPLTSTAVDAQLIDQLKWTAENVCACFHVPGYMVGIGPPPPYTDIQSINLQYYTQALQNPIENMEILLDEGLELSGNLHIEFDLDALARMDAKTQMETAAKGVQGSIYKVNEARAKFDLQPVDGGDDIYMQQQMYSLTALQKRDAIAAAPPTPALTPASPTPAVPQPTKAIDRDALLARVLRGLQQAA